MMFVSPNLPQWTLYQITRSTYIYSLILPYVHRNQLGCDDNIVFRLLCYDLGHNNAAVRSKNDSLVGQCKWIINSLSIHRYVLQLNKFHYDSALNCATTAVTTIQFAEINYLASDTLSAVADCLSGLLIVNKTAEKALIQLQLIVIRSNLCICFLSGISIFNELIAIFIINK